MNNIKSHIFIAFYSAIFALVFIFSSCGDNNKNSDEPVIALKLNSQSISNNQEIASTIDKLILTYNYSIALNSDINITVNDSKVNCLSNDNQVIIPLSLGEGKTYIVSIPKGAIYYAENKQILAPELSITFSTTKDKIELVNQNATKEAINVFNFLKEQFGKKTLSGVMAEVNNNNKMAEWVYAVTGKHPALTGYDFIHLNYSPANWIDYSDITPAKAQWDNNGLVTYMWHWNVPSNENDPVDKYGFYCPGKSGDGQSETQFDIREALKEGTWQHKLILKDIEKVASYLKLLQNQNIPVIWRPLHEAVGDYKNGAWFWWGRYGTQYTKQLWTLLYDKLTNEYGLNNLIWVWTLQVDNGTDQQIIDSYPGNDYVDIVAADIYASNTDSQIAKYSKIKKITDGKKIIALAETGVIQDPDKCYASGDKWSWFMEWYKYGITSSDTQDGYGNTIGYWTKIMTNTNVITRESMPNLK